MKPRILFVYQLPSPFILQDLETLQRHAQVTAFRWSDHSHPARALSIWMLAHRREFDLVFIWFGDAHASVATRAAKLLRKPSVLVVGGYDVSEERGYGYLSTNKGLRRARAHFERATRILAVSESLCQEVVRRFPTAKGRTVVLPTGVDSDKFRAGGPKDGTVLSVAGASEWKRAWIKGWDRIVEAAWLLPDVRFRLIGAAPSVSPRLRGPSNAEVFGPMDQRALISHYQAASVYVQASRTEGLPNTLLEAMASGCVPVVTRVGGMPEAVDGVGFVVEQTGEAIAEGVRAALSGPERGNLARRRAAERFSLAQRERHLTRILGDLIGSTA